MEQTSFHPGTNRESDDAVSRTLKNIAQFILIVTCGFSPLLFLPSPFLPLVYGKTLIVFGGVMLAILFYALHVLREGTYVVRMPLAYVALWPVVVVAMVSGALSGDIRDALLGDTLETTTAGSLAFLAVLVGSIGMLRGSKIGMMRLYICLIASAVVLSAYHVLRLVLGVEFLSFGFFTTSTSSPLGGWNDLALFFGLSLLLCMLALEQLPLTRIGRVVIALVALIGLVMLAVINFFMVWVMLAAIGFIVLVYNLTKNRFSAGQMAIDDGSQGQVGVVLLSAVVSIVSVLFLIMGSTFGGWISNVTQVSYVEVRPSAEATLGIAREVYQSDAVLGYGPNRFADAWRVFKDPSINETIFWETSFRSGNSFVTTSFVELGVLGVVTWVTFFILLLMAGFRMLSATTYGDRFWRFVGVSSFVATLYFWCVSIFYVPGVATLLLTAICTGIFLVAYSTIIPVRTYTLTVLRNRNLAFVFVAGIIILIVAVVSASYVVVTNASSIYSFNKALASIAPGDTIEELEITISNLYNQTQNDTFARQIALYELAQIRALLSLPEPTEVERQAFQTSVAEAINAGQAAVQADASNPLNAQVLAQVYALLAGIGIEGAYDRAKESLATAKTYDPVNPVLMLLEAQVEAQAGNTDAARALAEEALSLRSRYTEAIILLTQLDIAAGDVDAAISRTQAIISLEPNNPVRWYQLAVLLTSQENRDAAISVLESAIELDENYANARYLLALQYAEAGQLEAAVAQLQIVRQLNPDNEFLATLIDQIEIGSVETAGLPSEPVSEPAVEEDVAGGSVIENGIDSNLITPVNTVPEAVGTTNTTTSTTSSAVEG